MSQPCLVLPAWLAPSPSLQASTPHHRCAPAPLCWQPACVAGLAAQFTPCSPARPHSWAALFCRTPVPTLLSEWLPRVRWGWMQPPAPILQPRARSVCMRGSGEELATVWPRCGQGVPAAACGQLWCPARWLLGEQGGTVPGGGEGVGKKSAPVPRVQLAHSGPAACPVSLPGRHGLELCETLTWPTGAGGGHCGEAELLVGTIP